MRVDRSLAMRGGAQEGTMARTAVRSPTWPESPCLHLPKPPIMAQSPWDLAQAEVVRPALQFPVESSDLLPLVEPGPPTVGQLADLATESLDHFRRRARPD